MANGEFEKAFSTIFGAATQARGQAFSEALAETQLKQSAQQLGLQAEEFITNREMVLHSTVLNALLQMWQTNKQMDIAKAGAGGGAGMEDMLNFMLKKADLDLKRKKEMGETIGTLTESVPALRDKESKRAATLVSDFMWNVNLGAQGSLPHLQNAFSIASTLRGMPIGDETGTDVFDHYVQPRLEMGTDYTFARDSERFKQYIELNAIPYFQDPETGKQISNELGVEALMGYLEDNKDRKYRNLDELPLQFGMDTPTARAHTANGIAGIVGGTLRRVYRILEQKTRQEQPLTAQEDFVWKKLLELKATQKPNITSENFAQTYAEALTDQQANKEIGVAGDVGAIMDALGINFFHGEVQHPDYRGVMNTVDYLMSLAMDQVKFDTEIEQQLRAYTGDPNATVEKPTTIPGTENSVVSAVDDLLTTLDKQDKEGEIFNNTYENIPGRLTRYFRKQGLFDDIIQTTTDPSTLTQEQEENIINFITRQLDHIDVLEFTGASKDDISNYAKGVINYIQTLYQNNESADRIPYDLLNKILQIFRGYNLIESGYMGTSEMRREYEKIIGPSIG